MRRALGLILLLAAALVVALVLRVRDLRAKSHGPAGGTGVIEGVDVNVTSRIPSRITKIHVREGDIVREGDLLVELDCREADASLEQARSQLSAAESSLAAANSSATSAGRSASAAFANANSAGSQMQVLEAQERLARVDLERTVRLAEEGAVAPAALDDARERHDALMNQIAAQRSTEGATRDTALALAGSGSAAKSQALAAESNVEVARAGVLRAEVDASECRLYAPRDAMVETRNLEPGEAVAPGTNVLGLTDVSEARTRFYLPNADLGAAAPGRKVRVAADAYPGQTFEGTIFYVSPRAEFTPRNVQTREDRDRLVYQVEVRIPNRDMRLRSGMPVEVAIEGSWR
jgi:multidrug resistance efflux pump